MSIISDGLLPGQISMPDTLEKVRHNAQVRANHEQQTQYIYEATSPTPSGAARQGFDRWFFTAIHNYDRLYPWSKPVEAVEPHTTREENGNEKD